MQVAFIYSIQGLGAKDIETRIDEEELKNENVQVHCAKYLRAPRPYEDHVQQRFSYKPL